MHKTYYTKVGRRYIPVAEYDSDAMNSFPYGAHVVVTKPGSTLRYFKVEAEYAAMIAAGMVAQDSISQVICNKLSARPSQQPVTDEQKAAWQALARAFGKDILPLEYPSVRDATAAGVQAMVDEVKHLMKHDGVRQAFEHFVLMCELTKKHQDEKSR